MFNLLCFNKEHVSPLSDTAGREEQPECLQELTSLRCFCPSVVPRRAIRQRGSHLTGGDETVSEKKIWRQKETAAAVLTHRDSNSPLFSAREKLGHNMLGE